VRIGTPKRLLRCRVPSAPSLSALCILGTQRTRRGPDGGWAPSSGTEGVCWPSSGLTSAAQNRGSADRLKADQPLSMLKTVASASDATLEEPSHDRRSTIERCPGWGFQPRPGLMEVALLFWSRRPKQARASRAPPAPASQVIDCLLMAALIVDQASRERCAFFEVRFAHLKTHHRFERMRLRGLSAPATSSTSPPSCRTSRPWRSDCCGRRREFLRVCD